MFVFPSLEEGFGLPVLEAMSAGCPVLASTIPAIQEIAAGAARLVDPRDVSAWAAALADLLGDAAARAELRRAGRRRAAEYTPRRMAEQTATAYLRALSA